MPDAQLSRPRPRPSVFVGREAELATLAAHWGTASHGVPSTVLIQGPAGIGKTTLLDAFLATIGTGLALRLSGDETESAVGLALVDQLMWVAGAPGLDLLAAEDASRSHVAAGTRVLKLLDRLQEEGPVVLVVDDAHWADAQSLAAILFAVRRLTVDRVLVVVSARDGDHLVIPAGLRRSATAPGGATLTLAPLAAGELTALAAADGVTLSPLAARRLSEHTQGNLVHARSLLAELPVAAWLEPDSLPAPRPLSALVRNRVGRSAAGAQRVIEAVAVLGSDAPLGAAAAVADVEDFIGALDEAVDLGLLCEHDAAGGLPQTLAFTHPLIRAAVYGGLSPARRRELHGQAAAVVEDHRASLHHRAAAATDFDARLPAELDELAGEHAARGDWSAAAGDLRAAGTVSDCRADREQRYLRSLDHLVMAGEVERARALATAAGEFEATAHRDLVLGNLALLSANPADAEPLLDGAWARCDQAREPVLAMNIARRQALLWLLRMDGERCVQWSRRAVASLCESPQTRAVLADAHAVHAAGLARLGRFAEAHRALAPALEAGGDPGLAVASFRGWLRLVEDDVDGTVSDLRAGAPAALRSRLLDLAAASYTFLARAEFLAGAWDDAALHAARAVAIALDHEHALTAFVWDATICVATARGDHELAGSALTEASRKVLHCEDRTAWLGVSRAVVAAGRGDVAGVLAALGPLTQLAPTSGIAEPGLWPWQDLYADALIDAGELDDADAFLRPHEAIAMARGRDSALARLARVRGRLAAGRGDAAAAHEAFETAARHAARVRMPYEQALIELAYGAFLRRHGERRAAVARLQSAQATMTALGARPALARCEHELERCGLAPVKRTPRSGLHLTATERSVTRLVASGLSNPEVAAELMVSVRTIEFHLTRIYSKLGLRSRGQLAANVAAGAYVPLGVEPPPPPEVR